MRRLKCFYSPGYFVPLPAGHPFPVEKYAQTLGLLKDHKRSNELEFIQVKPAVLEDVLRVHDSGYAQAVQADQLAPYDRNRLGLPHHPRFWERSLLDCQGTIEAAYAALESGVAWNIGGGTHHAMADQGLGFCVTNDVAVAIGRLRETHPDLNILVLDTDAHQGNGTHKLLREDALSFTYSIHVGRNYPSQKEPGDMDVPMERYCSGEAYCQALRSSLDSLLNLRQFDLVFWVSGVDVHEQDRFGQMKLSDDDIRQRDEIVLEFVSCNEAAVVGTLGGGYHAQIECVPAMHVLSVMRSLKLL